MDLKRKSQSGMRALKPKAWIAALPAVVLWTGDAAALTHLELLGKYVFFDKISRPEDSQSCASCHAPARGWTLPDSNINKTTVSAPGARAKRSGSLKPPANAYAFFHPPFRANGNPLPFVIPFEGGNFWDGRAEGFGKLGGSPVDPTTASKTVTLADIPASKQSVYAQYLGPTADQALNPFPNGVEQNIRIKRVCKNVRDASYSKHYYKAYGEDINCKGVETDPTSPVSISFRRIALALAAYQGSKEVSPFDSKRDWALKTDTDGNFPLDGFTDQENLGHDLFYGTNDTGLNGGEGQPPAKNANCAACHSGLPGVAGPTNAPPPFGNGLDIKGTNARQLYADSFFHNIALPYNREIKQTVLDANGKVVDNGVTVAPQEKKGLSQHVTSLGANQGGLFKSPTLRNVGKGATWGFVKAYMHNGYFKSLEDVVHFYNTRSIPDLPKGDVRRTIEKCEDLGITNATAAEAKKYNCWPVAEFNLPNSAAPFLLGDLRLTDREEAALVAYLKTLSDTTTAKAP